MNSHHEYMEQKFGDKWRDRVKAGRCWLVQDTIFNPFDGRGLDVKCLVHDCCFNVPTEIGNWNIEYPQVCPQGQKNKLD